MSQANIPAIWKIINEEPSITELRKENRALDMELMEAYEKIRSLENTLAFLKLTKFGTKNEKL
jgi:predicted RNase H-like nuclease (RuvC/YqgF family)